MIHFGSALIAAHAPLVHLPVRTGQCKEFIMSRLYAVTMLLAASLLGLSAGCADSEQDRRMVMLEDQNRSLQQAVEEANRRMRALDEERTNLATDRNRAGADRQRLMTELAAERQANQDLQARLDAVPPPAPVASGWTRVEGGAMIRLKGSVLFKVGSNALTDQARKTLDQVAAVIKSDYADKDILVIGHTDDQPIEKSGWDDNYQLSAERSLAVVRYLLGRGIPATRLVVSGCGEYRPRAENVSSANREMNRRVELFAIELSALSEG